MAPLLAHTKGKGPGKKNESEKAIGVAPFSATHAAESASNRGLAP